MVAMHVLGDWGSTNLRLFRMHGEEIVDQKEGPGTTLLDRPAADLLADLLTDWCATGLIEQVTLCGMAGSAAGLAVTPYLECPTAFKDWSEGGVFTQVSGIPVRILQGLSHRADGKPDVMRGEETQIFGTMAIDEALSQGRHLLVLPGTHSKWAVIDDGIITSFHTAPTGELYALLAEHSSLPGGAGEGEGTFEQGFNHALDRAAEPLLGAVFQARAARMLDGRSQPWAKGYLSGLLIGNEIAQFASGIDQVMIVGAPELSRLYQNILTSWGTNVRMVDGGEAALQGLIRATGTRS